MLRQLLILVLVLLFVPLFAQKALKKGHFYKELIPSASVQNFDDLQVFIPAGSNPAVNLRGGEEKQLGSSSNLYTILLDGQNQVAYNPDLNAVTFVHRQNNGAAGGSGMISYDYSLDGGKTWNTGNNRVTPTLDISGDSTKLSNGNRYPSGTIYNPPGNTDPANAFFVAAGPSLHTDPVNGNGWGYEFVGSSKLDYDGNGVVENYYTNSNETSFHPYGLTANPDGSLWYVSTKWDTDADPQSSTTDSYDEFYLCKLTFNGSGFDREVKEVFEPNWGFLGDSAWHLQGDYDLAFSPDGETGYFVYVTTDVDNENYGDGIGVKPVIWKTIDGGDSWTKYAQVDYQSMTELLNWTFFSDTNQNGFADDTTGIIIPYMSSMDMVVDKNGDLNIFAHMFSRSNIAIDSMGFGWFSGDSISTLFHFITDGVDWDAKFVDLYGCGNGAVGAVGVGVRPQASRTPDGSAIFFTYLQSWDLNSAFTSFLDANNTPDIFAYGYSVDNGTSLNKWLTDPFGDDELLLTGNYYYATMSPVCIAGGEERYFELPIAFADPSDSDVTPAQFYYLYGLGFTQEELGFTSATEAIKKVDFKVYPNPAGQNIFLKIENQEKPYEVIVSDALGKAVRYFPNERSTTTITTNQLPNGLYYVSVKAGNQLLTKKIAIFH
jgi:hypothetical protein